MDSKAAKDSRGRFVKGHKFAVGRGRPKSPYVCVRKHLGEDKIKLFWDKMFAMSMEGDVSAARVLCDRLPSVDPIPVYNHVSKINTHKDIDKAVSDIIEWSKDPDKALSIDEINTLIRLLMTKRETIESAVNEQLREEMIKEGIKDE